MRYLREKLSLTMLLVVALIALLPSLAILQYRWLGQVSQGERERMQASLRVSVNNFSEDFDRVISLAYFTLQMDLESLKAHDWSKFGERYNFWQTATPHARMVKSIYLITKDHDQLNLYQFNTANHQFNQLEWPAELAPIRARCQQEAEIGLFPIPGISQPVTVINNELSLLIPGSFIPQLPDKIMVTEPTKIQVQVDKAAAPNETLPENLNIAVKERIDPRDAFTYTLVKLDQEYIRTEMLPELVKRYFFNDNQLDYHIAILDNRSGQNLIYQSDQTIDRASINEASADAGGKLLRVRFDQFDRIFFNHPLAKVPASPKRIIITNDASKKEEKLPKRFESSQTTISIVRTQPRSNQPDNIKFARHIDGDNDGSMWSLVVKHRAGSLEAAVASVRQRNLMLSFGILLLLSISMAMLIVSTRRAQRLAKQQMEFVAGVSHELRTPLAVICSAGENLADGVINNSQQVKRYGELIKSEGRRLHEMVEQVLEFAGWQSNRKAYQSQPIDINGVIERAIATCQPLVSEGSFNLELDIAANLPSVMGDAAALQRAVQNLLSNAMKYSSESRWIGIKAALNRTGRELEIVISDRGLGIAANELPHIFEPFYRGQEVMAAQIHGTGLGLSIVKQIVEACNGRISVDSAPGRGSAFTITLPIITESSEAKTATTKGDYEQANFAGGR